jgi:sodium-dependent dicarboxylate transporter 2/3/5
MAVGSYTVSNTSNNEDAEKVKVPPWYRQLWDIKLTIIVILAPIAFLPLPILVPTGAGKCAYAILIMATYWMTEVIPMAVTALLPVVIFPWIGIMDTKDICQNYLKDANMLFFGGLMVAVAVERWNLHKRIAMRVLMLVGTKPPWLMFGFMATTAFLSMWISNTATTAMMVPIAHAVLTELNSHRLKLKAEAAQASANDKHESIDMDVFKKDRSTKETDDDTQSNGHTSTSSKQTNAKKKKPEMDAEDAWFQKVGKGMRLSIAYAANIGGTATLTGTGPNLVLKGQIDLIYGPDTGINFTSWFVFGFPNMIVSLIVAWFLMMLIFLGPREIAGMFRRTKKGEARDSAADVVQSEYEKLGPMSFAELMVLIHFIVLALLWLTRDPEVVPGWQAILPNKFVTDSCVAITISVLLFIVPSQFPSYLFFRRKSETRKPEMAPALLDWPTIHKGIPWNVMLLLGGGFALADGCKASGLSQVIGKFFCELRCISFLAPCARPVHNYSAVHTSN